MDENLILLFYQFFDTEVIEKLGRGACVLCKICNMYTIMTIHNSPVYFYYMQFYYMLILLFQNFIYIIIVYWLILSCTNLKYLIYNTCTLYQLLTYCLSVWRSSLNAIKEATGQRAVQMWIGVDQSTFGLYL